MPVYDTKPRPELPVLMLMLMVFEHAENVTTLGLFCFFAFSHHSLSLARSLSLSLSLSHTFSLLCVYLCYSRLLSAALSFSQLFTPSATHLFTLLHLCFQDGDFPRQSHIHHNIVREVGLFEKQSSAWFQAKTAQTHLHHNVFLNGPRAGINFNDGFGGGNNISQNLLFNFCRDSGDHGPFNSWDRQMFLVRQPDDQGTCTH